MPHHCCERLAAYASSNRLIHTAAYSGTVGTPLIFWATELGRAASEARISVRFRLPEMMSILFRSTFPGRLSTLCASIMT